MTRFLRSSVPPSLIILSICDFLLLWGCFLFSTYLTEDNDLSFYVAYDGGWIQIAIAVLSIQLTLYLERMYERFAAFWTIVGQMVLALGIAFLIQSVLVYAGSPLQIPRWSMISASGVSLLIFPLWRLAAAAALRKGVPVRTILFLGANSAAAEVAQRLKRQPELGLVAIGFVGPEAPEPVVRLGGIAELDAVLEEYGPGQIVIARNISGIPIRRLIDLERSGVRIEKLATLYESVAQRISLLELPPERLIFSQDLDARPSYILVQRIYSVFLAALLLAITAPVFGIAVLMSKRPIFEYDHRQGFRGAPITLYRFRHAGWSWVRGLPLLLNMLKGDLVFVGPSPERPAFAAALRQRVPLYNQRLSVKPGLTGWAQVHSDNGIPDTLTRLEYDLYYIKHLSPVLDAYIALLTMRRCW